MAERANLPVTGPRAANHQEAKTLQQSAQDAIDGVTQGKRQAASMAAGSPDADYAKKAASAKKGTYPPGGFDAVHSVRRNPAG